MRLRKQAILLVTSLLLLLSGSSAAGQDETLPALPAPPLKFEVTWTDKAAGKAYFLYIQGSNAPIINFWKSKARQHTAMTELGGTIIGRPGMVTGFELPFPPEIDFDSVPVEDDMYIAIEYDGWGQ